MKDDKSANDGAKVLGVAVKYTARLLKAFVDENEKLRAQVAAIQTKEDELAWFPVSVLVELFNLAIEKGVFEQLAKSTATNVIKAMAASPGIDSPIKALHTIAQSFPMQHKGNVGEILITSTGSNSAEVVDGTYAPCGYVIGLAEMAVAGYGGSSISIAHEPEHCRNHQNTKCVYQITWQ